MSSSDDVLDGLAEEQAPPPKVVRIVGQAPATPVVVAPQSTLHLWLAIIGLNFITFFVTIGLTAWILGGRREERAASNLTVIATEYMKTLPDAYHEVAERVRDRELKTLTKYRDALKEHAKALAEAQEVAAKSKSDDKGTITNPDGLADDLEAVSVGLAKGVR